MTRDIPLIVFQRIEYNNNNILLLLYPAGRYIRVASADAQIRWANNDRAAAVAKSLTRGKRRFRRNF